MSDRPLGTKKSYRFWLPALVLICIVAAIGAFLITRPRVKITQHACDQIEIGMTRDEVEAIIGGLPGNHSGPVGRLFRGDVSLKWTMPGTATRLQWFDSDGIIVVCFDQDGKVIGKKYHAR